MITTREIKVAMRDMGPRNWIAGVESPEDRHAVTGSCAALIASLAESRSTETINQHHAFRLRCKNKILQP